MLIGERNGFLPPRCLRKASSLQENLRLSQTMEAFLGAGSKKKPYGSVFKTSAPRASLISYL